MQAYQRKSEVNRVSKQIVNNIIFKVRAKWSLRLIKEHGSKY